MLDYKIMSCYEKLLQNNESTAFDSTKTLEKSLMLTNVTFNKMTLPLQDFFLPDLVLALKSVHI